MKGMISFTCTINKAVT